MKCQVLFGNISPEFVWPSAQGFGCLFATVSKPNSSKSKAISELLSLGI